MSEHLDAEHVRDGDQRRWAAGRAVLLRRMAGAGRRRVAMGKFASINVFAMLLFAVLVLALFLALVSGTTAYRSIVDDDRAARDIRMGTSLVANIVRAADSSGFAAVGEGPEGRALVLKEHLDSGTFETRLYLHDGWIVEEYAVEGAAYDPDNAVRMTPSETFSFEIQPTKVRICCDEGETVVALRADGAVEDGDAARVGDLTEGGE